MAPSQDDMNSDPTRAAIEKLIKSQLHDYSEIEFKGEGGTSYVWRVTHARLGDSRALKVLKPHIAVLTMVLDDGTKVQRQLRDYFDKEIRYILRVKDEHVIRLFDAGKLKDDAGFGDLPWYTMEYLEGTDSIDMWLKKEAKGKQLTERRLVELLTKLARAIAACHAQRVIHADIKPSNIQVGHNGKLVLTDFGFSKALDESDEGDHDRFTLWVGTLEYLPDEIEGRIEERRSKTPGMAMDANVTYIPILRDELKAKGFVWDLNTLGKTIRKLLSHPDVRAVCDRHGKFLDMMSERLVIAGSGRNNAYREIGEVQKDLEKLQVGFSLDGVYEEFDPYPVRGILVPGIGRLPRTPRLISLIDLPVLQRLRGVRQLGITHLAFPGATHTRFEHSLGVFGRVIQFVKVLWTARDYSYFRQTAKTEDINALLVAALLHDIGHYPMAHAFEEVEPQSSLEFKHDELSAQMLTGTRSDLMDEAAIANLRKILAQQWNIDIGDVLAVMTGVRTHAKTINRELVELLHSILDGPLDADKLDYLQRDSLHCGYDGTSGFDEERFLRSLIAPDRAQSIAIRERGIPAVESLFLARHKMFLTVYWNRNNRAAERMIAEAVRLIYRKNPSGFRDLFFPEAFRRDDEGMLALVAELLADERRASDLINPLRSTRGAREGLYVRKLTIASGKLVHPTRVADPELHGRISEFFQNYIEGTNPWQYPMFEMLLRESILRRAGEGVLGHEVLVDVPDPRASNAKHETGRSVQFDVYADASSHSAIDFATGWFQTLLEDWRVDARRIRVMVSPAAAAKLSDVSREEMVDLVRNAVSEVRGQPAKKGGFSEQVEAGWASLDSWGKTSPVGNETPM